MEPDCVSINVHKQVSGHGGYKCELNNVTHERREYDLKNEDHYFYHAAEVGVASLAYSFQVKEKTNFPVIIVAIVDWILISLSIFLSLVLIIIVGLNAAHFAFY